MELIFKAFGWDFGIVIRKTPAPQRPIINVYTSFDKEEEVPVIRRKREAASLGMD
jgi:hypothetical protein